MNDYIAAAKKYIQDHKKQFITGAEVVGGFAIIAILIGFVSYSTSLPKYKYEPVKACDLLTPAKAQDLLGDRVISTEANTPSVDVDTAISKCSYTDTNPNKTKMMVAAVAVQSAVDDKGITQIKDNFAANKKSVGIQDVANVGDSAYFNPTNGQLNVQKNRMWIIISYGVGQSPEANTVDKAIELAHKILDK